MLRIYFLHHRELLGELSRAYFVTGCVAYSRTRDSWATGGRSARCGARTARDPNRTFLRSWTPRPCHYKLLSVLLGERHSAWPKELSATLVARRRVFLRRAMTISDDPIILRDEVALLGDSVAPTTPGAKCSERAIVSDDAGNSLQLRPIQAYHHNFIPPCKAAVNIEAAPERWKRPWPAPTFSTTG